MKNVIITPNSLWKFANEMWIVMRSETICPYSYLSVRRKYNDNNACSFCNNEKVRRERTAKRGFGAGRMGTEILPGIRNKSDGYSNRGRKNKTIPSNFQWNISYYYFERLNVYNELYNPQHSLNI